MFRHIHHEFPKLERIDRSTGRVYACPTSEGLKEFPSVTTILSSNPEKNDSLNAWKKAVGEDVASKISKKASDRGTRIHQLVEDFVTNNESKADLLDREIWNPMKVLIKTKINNIHAVEQQMFSSHLRCAGTADLVAEYDGVLSIIDIKTSKKIKLKSDIWNYFEQCAVYSIMFQELTGEKAKRLQIVMGCDDTNSTLLFDDYDRNKYLKTFLTKRDYYEKVNN